ncbi:NAD(P)-binding domain protein [Metarhizium guizhouense ARSEF 977]|uniref:NAD(P)-binding domain protein n=1 Tax=Metarhizium guizhouense (strain ARSEF 977) TaxID=1276136 RepID=A0A0B4GVG7_METGA|nr:NAD(P)-binding domain protein [Metarhizium guizhouense ARSEF 977]
MSEMVILITASSAGLGAAIAKSLITSHRVVINYNSSPQHAHDVLEELLQLSTSSNASHDDETPRAIAIQADVSKPTEIRRLVAETVTRMGRLDGVVSNAGWTSMRNFSDLDDNIDEDDWDRCFTVNVKSHLFLLTAAREHLDETEGSFITVASVAGVRPSGSSLPYAVSKAAQIYLVKCLAGIVSPKIRINSVSPGILMTNWGRQFPEETLHHSMDKTLLGRFATVEV